MTFDYKVALCVMMYYAIVLFAVSVYHCVEWGIPTKPYEILEEGGDVIIVSFLIFLFTLIGISAFLSLTFGLYFLMGGTW